jgi:hypothetical protein
VSVSLEQALADRFGPPTYAIFFEVGERPGYPSRRADALALSVWKSRGFRLHGFELKRSRGDWKRELADPAKADLIASFCDHFWLVVSDSKIVKPGELPPTWGLLVQEGDGPALVQKVDAPKLEPQPWTRAFIAAMLRAGQANTVPKATVEAMVERLAEERVELRRRIDRDDYPKLRARYEELEAKVQAFEKASGITIQYVGHVWPMQLRDLGQVGAAVRLLLNGGLDTQGLIEVKNSLGATMRQLDEAIEMAGKLPKAAAKENGDGG